jgi:hypothetical protein
MVRAFHAFIRAIRKQPNHFAVACGLFMFLLPGVFMDAALRASGRIRYGDETPPPVPPVLAPMVALWGRFADSGFGLAVVLSVMGAGILLALLGVARVFRPKQ